MSEVSDHDKPPLVIIDDVGNDASREYEDVSEATVACTASEASPAVKSRPINPIGPVSINVEEAEQVRPSAGCSGDLDVF